MFRWAAGLSGFPPRQRVPGIADASLTAEVPPAKAARGRRLGLLAQARGECIPLHAAGIAEGRISNQDGKRPRRNSSTKCATRMPSSVCQKKIIQYNTITLHPRY